MTGGPKTASINVVFVYIIVQLAVVFGINSASNAGRNFVIVQDAAEHYYNFHTCIVRANHTVTA